MPPPVGFLVIGIVCAVLGWLVGCYKDPNPEPFTGGGELRFEMNSITIVFWFVAFAFIVSYLGELWRYENVAHYWDRI